MLHAAAPDDVEVLFAPFDVVLANDTVIQPDLIVAPTSDQPHRTRPPHCSAPRSGSAIPSTRGVDLMLKRERLQRAGCPHYWLVDPDEPSVTALALHNGVYREVARAAAHETFSVRLLCR
ncbi:Uma2 family endonuclease [Propionimicrobium sp. PCR01-08-3]|uniref:Uma2 family endonuclease n=1 Tax=Propionimicrobium sp. PCR01-08-3 TaxID=3052086 RepID=UPI00333E9EDD